MSLLTQQHKMQTSAPQRGPRTSNVPAKPQPTQARRFADTLALAKQQGTAPVPQAPVRQPEAPKSPLARFFKPAAPTGFEQIMSKNPQTVWSKELTPFTKAALNAYQKGQVGNSVRGLDLRGMTAGAIRTTLLRRGFKMEKSNLRDFKTGQPLVDPITGEPIPMEVWCHEDGGMVRLKPQGDPTNKHRPQPHASVSVKYPPDASGHDFNHEAFKLDYAGNPLPKWAKDANNPYGDTAAGKQFLDDLADRTHSNLA
ncbi:MAG TPA: hypothetical protein V6D47_04920 [Oscillatoriaceae cyanobacterium]